MKEYEDKIAQLIYNEIKKLYKKDGENYKIIDVDRQIYYEVIEVKRLNDFHIEAYKPHELLSPKGYKISGAITISLRVYKPIPDEPRNMQIEPILKFVLKDIPVKFDNDTEDFKLTDDMHILYVTDRI